MNSDWNTIVTKYAELKGISYNRAYQLALLIWVDQNVVRNESGFDPTPYEDYRLMLDGKSPVKGRWVKSAAPRKTVGSVRPDNDPTCFTFEAFKKGYAFSKGSWKEAKLAYSKLSEDIRESIKSTLPLYVRDTCTKDIKGPGWKPMRAGPAKYINQAYWEQYIDQIKARDWSIPADADDYRAYLVSMANRFPELADSDLKLTYQEHDSLRGKCWEKDFVVNVSGSVLSNVSTDAHLKSLREGGLVFDNFIELLKARNV